MKPGSRIHILILVVSLTMALPFSVFAEPRVVYNLSLNGDLWGNRVNSYFQFDDNFLPSNLNMSMSGPLLRAGLGDITASWDELAFAHRSFRGLELKLPVGKFDATLLGGTVSMPDLLGQKRDSAVYGLRAGIPLSKYFRLDASQLFTPGVPSAQEGISSLALSYQPALHHRLSLELAQNHLRFGGQLSWASEWKRFSVRTGYRQINSDFSTASNPLLNTNRNGFFMDARYRIFQPLSFSLNSQRYNDGLGGSVRFDSSELQLAFHKLPSLALRWQSSDYKRPMSKGSRTSLQEMGLRLSYSFRFNYLFFQYSRPQFQFHNNPMSDMITDRFIIGNTSLLNQKTILTFNHVLDMNKSIQPGSQAGSGSISRFTTMQVERQLGTNGLSFNLGLMHQDSRYAKEVGRSLSIKGGLNLPVMGNSIGIDYQTNLRSSGFLRSQSSGILFVRYQQNFQVGKRSSAEQLFGENTTQREPSHFGKLSGGVFEDKNGNQQWDQGEPGVPNVTVAVERGSQVQTDRNGLYAIMDVYPGDSRVKLAIETLPIELTPLTSTEVNLQVSTSNLATVNFAVVRTGQVKGKVYWDENRNGKWDEGEQIMANVPVKVENSEIIGITDAQGNFILYNLPPKRWQVKVDVEVLGEDYEATGPGLTEIDVLPGGEVTNVDLGVASKELPIINTFEKEIKTFN